MLETIIVFFLILVWIGSGDSLYMVAAGLFAIAANIEEWGSSKDAKS